MPGGEFIRRDSGTPLGKETTTGLSDGEVVSTSILTVASRAADAAKEPAFLFLWGDRSDILCCCNVLGLIAIRHERSTHKAQVKAERTLLKLVEPFLTQGRRFLDVNTALDWCEGWWFV